MHQFEPNLEILRAFKRVQEGLRHHFESKFKDLGLTGPQAILIGILAHKGPLRIGDLSEQMHLTNSTVSSIVDRLEHQGYVSRIRSESDKRVVQVDLTKSFRDQAKHRFCGVEGEMATILSKASEAERQKIYDGLSLLADLIDAGQKTSKEE